MVVQEVFTPDSRLHAVVDSLPHPVSAFDAVRDEQGRIADFVWVYANDAAAAVTGYSRCELIGTMLRDALPEGFGEQSLEIYENVVESGEPYTNPAQWLEDHDSQGNPVRRAFDVRVTKCGDGFAVISREVTEELRAAELHASRAALIAAVTHDFRTPLTGIVGLSWLLDTDWEAMPDEKRREYVQDIVRCGEELDRRITTTLEHLRVESGMFEIETDACNIGDELRATVDRMTLMLAPHAISFDVPADLTVAADHTALARVVENLLSNAAKYSPPESLIGLCAERSGDEVIISVTDEGPGISEADAQRIFDQFHRLESGRQLAHGNGVGLSAVRQLVELMHGRVWVDSVVGLGSAFRFTLPVATGA